MRYCVRSLSSTRYGLSLPEHGVQPEVRHAVSSYYHGALLFVERVYDGLQGMGVAVQVIAVKLYGEAPAPGMVDCEVPASPYAQVGTLGLKVDYRFVLLVLTNDSVVPSVE